MDSEKAQTEMVRPNMVINRARVLVVEDEIEIRDLITLHLQREGYFVDALASGEEAVTQLSKQKYDLVLLDWMLPGVSGLEITRIIRTKSNQKNVPVLMVTARVEPGDIILGLEAGADDYVTKPFDTKVLIARARALIRRLKFQEQIKDESPNVLEVGGLKMNIDAHEVFCNGEQIHLTPSEFKLLHVLSLQSGKVFTREALIKEVQGSGVSVVDRAIDTHVFGLRKKLGVCSDVLETIRGIGYRVKPIDHANYN